MNSKAKTTKAAVAGGVVGLAAGLVGTTVLVGQSAAETTESTTAGRQQPASAYHGCQVYSAGRLATVPGCKELLGIDGFRNRDDQAARDSDIETPPANWRRLMDEVDSPTPTGSEQDGEPNLPRDDGSHEYEEITLGGLAGATVTAVVAGTVARRRLRPTERDEGEVGTTDLASEPERLREPEFEFYGEILESPRRGR